MTILIDLSVAGVNTGPFNLYSDADGYTSAFATNITRQQLLDGYPAVVAAGTTNIKLQSLSDVCPNDTILPVSTTTSTTTTLNCSFIVNAQEITTTTTTTQAPSPYRCIKVDGCDGLGYRSIPFNSSTAMVGDVIPYYVVADPNTILCGTVVDINYISFADSFRAVGNPIVCGDETYCNIPNPFPP